MTGRDDKPTARPVEFSPAEVELAAGVLEALCDGERPYVMNYQRPVLTDFCRKLRALGVPTLDASELRDEGEQGGDA
jgi:hypothetical protein